MINGDGAGVGSAMSAHPDLQMISFGNSSSQKLSGGRMRSKADRRQDEEKFLKIGTFYHSLGRDDEFEVIDDQHIRWKASFKNVNVEADRDYLVTIKDTNENKISKRLVVYK